MPYFSGEEKDPVRRKAHRAMEDLSYHAQQLQGAAIADMLNLPAAELTQLTRFLRTVTRLVRQWRERLWSVQPNAQEPGR
jgi:hypothetical protein